MFETLCTLGAIAGALVIFVFVLADFMPDWMRM